MKLIRQSFKRQQILYDLRKRINDFAIYDMWDLGKGHIYLGCELHIIRKFKRNKIVNGNVVRLEMNF